MMPGMNSRQARQMMKKMGIQQQDIEATEVIIKTNNKEIIIQNPQVAKVNMMGQQTYQVIGEAVERELSTEAEISDDDINTVVEQTGKGADEARNAIEKHDGDLAAAIMELSEE